MSIFARRRDPIAAIEGEIADLTRRGDRLQARLRESEGELEAAQRTRRDALLADDVDAAAIERATASVNGIQLRIAGLTDALAEIGEQRQAAEAKLAATKDAAERERVAAVMATTHTEISRCLAAFMQSSGDLLKALGGVTAGALLASQARQFAEGLGFQVGGMLSELEGRRHTMLAGGPIPAIRAPVETAAVITAPAIERMRIYTLARVMWREPDGSMAFGLKYSMLALPIEPARRAIATGAVMAEDDPRVSNLRAVYGIVAYAPLISPLPDALDLDTPPALIAPIDAGEPVAAEEFA
jgi:hypothetical protein